MEGRPSRFRKPSIKLVEAIDASSKGKRRRAGAKSHKPSDWSWGEGCPQTMEELVSDMATEREGWDGLDCRNVLPRDINECSWEMDQNSPDDDFLFN
eukprot:758931-Hanusia_phi.AAC.7